MNAPIPDLNPEAPRPHLDPADALDFLLRARGPQGDGVTDKSRGKVLEVAALWGDTLMSVKHYARGGEPVTLGAGYGHRWRVLGAPVAWVPSSFARLAWLAAPTISEAAEEWRSEFYVPQDAVPHDDFPLFAWSEGAWVCRFDARWTGFLDLGEQRRSLADLVASGQARRVEDGLYEVELGDDGRFIVDLGPMILCGHLVYPGRKVAAAMTETLDYPFLGIMALVSFVSAVMSFLILTTPESSSDMLEEDSDKYAVELMQQIKPPPTVAEKQAPAGEREGAKAKEKEGKRGEKTAKLKVAKGDQRPASKQKIDQEVAQNSGLLAAMNENDSLRAMQAQDLGFDLSVGIGGPIGARGTAFGNNGLGGRGDGLGGGGTADNVLGTGTKGVGPDGRNYGRPDRGGQPVKAEGTLTPVGDPTILGALDKSLVDAVIKRHMSQIRYCYQRELNKNPELGGKIVVKFVIARDGTVSKADVKSSTMGSAAVESCITGRFMRFQFPEPKGGGIVIVSYPFMFSPG